MKVDKANLFILFLIAVLVSAPPVSAQNAQMTAFMQQLTQLEAEVRQLRGEVEQLRYENRRLKSQRNDIYLDVDSRLKVLEAGRGKPDIPVSVAGQQPRLIPNQSAVSGQPVPPAIRSVTDQNNPAPVSNTASAQPLSPAQPEPAADNNNRQGAAPVAGMDVAGKQADDYKTAFNMLKVGKYDEAIIAYSDFIRRYPQGQYTAKAQYWLGYANYVKRQFPLAIDEFNKVITHFPNSAKAPDAMWNLGNIYYELKDGARAREILTSLINKYPGKTAARLAENKLRRMKLEGL